MLPMKTKRLNSRNRLAGVLACVALCLSACAAPRTQQPALDPALVLAEQKMQQAIAFETLVGDYQRIYDVGYQVLQAAVPICANQSKPDVRAGMGWLVTNLADIPAELRTVAAERFNYSAALQIVHVAKHSPAANAGLQAGDKLIAIANRELPTGEQAAKRFDVLEKDLLFIGQPVPILVERQNQRFEVLVKPEPVCSYRLAMVAQDKVNAFADGQYIAVTRGMLRFANDAELAVVIGHELAHNAQGHLDDRKRNSLLGFLVDLFAVFNNINTQGAFSQMGIYAYSQEYESEADYVGLYALALAGLDISIAPNFWRRMAALQPANIKDNHSATHPATARRFVALEATIAEIEQKQAAGLVLQPNLRE